MRKKAAQHWLGKKKQKKYPPTKRKQSRQNRDKDGNAGPE